MESNSSDGGKIDTMENNHNAADACLLFYHREQASVCAFLEPTGIISGGTTGVGLTIFPIETGFAGEKQKVILCAVTPRRLPRVKELLKNMDETSFVLVNSTTEVIGRGFTLPR